MNSFFEVIFSFLKKILKVESEKVEDQVDEKVCENPVKGKKSLHIGINNYPGTANDLRGCVNDAKNWQKLLKDQYCFSTSILTDSNATYNNVVKAIKDIIDTAEPNGHIVITFSGHGTNVRDVSGDEEDKRDEALCLYDRLLLDDQLRELLNKLPQKTLLTFISDSCHSGTVTRSFLRTLENEESPVPRYLPPEDDEEVFTVAPSSVSKKFMIPEKDMNEILITGCQSTEYSYDARIGGNFQGAMSANAIKILKSNPNCTYLEFYNKLRSALPSRNFPQSPQLEGSSKNKNNPVFS